MHPRFVSLLACPKTGESLTLEDAQISPKGNVVSGILKSASGATYPVIRAIPRFVGAEHYSASFGFEWNRWPRVQFESENVGKPMAGHTTRMWERIVGLANEDVSGKTLVEFGCGPGRFLDVVRAKGGTAVGLDLSDAVEAARHNFPDDPNVLIVQGDILNPPFQRAVFDGGYTIGVLHHTPKPAMGMRELAQRVKPGGWVTCCVYPNQGFYSFRSVRQFRWLHNNIFKPWFGYWPALIYSHFAARPLAYAFKIGAHIPVVRNIGTYLGENWLPWIWFPDVRWRVLDIFDGITPSYASTHVEQEVHDWLREAGCSEIRTTDWCDTSATARVG